MSAILGKRKRIISRRERLSPSSESDSEDSQGSHEALNVRDIFAKHFEARFAPLQKEEKSASERNEGIAVEDDGDLWDGLSSTSDEEEGTENAVLVVDHASAPKTDDMSKAELRAFMSSKPPSSSTPARGAQKDQKPKDAPETEAEEKLNLKNDLDLQRLINESHILDASRTSAANGLLASSRNRITDLRMQTLGSRKSAFSQEKMPMAHRRGIIAKTAERENRRRHEARENGIVLEKPARKKSKESEAKRVRGVGGPTVGKFKGGTLKLSQRDLNGMKRPPGKQKRK